MSKAIVLDTECTGLKEPDVIQLAYMGPLDRPLTVGGTATLHFQPTKPITLGAMAVHHIIPEDLVGCAMWPGSWSVPEGVEYIIGHNIDFDWQAIGSPANVKRICTLALARCYWPDLDAHNLSALTYHIHAPSTAREMLRHAHDATADVARALDVLVALHDAMGTPATWEDLWKISEQARVPKIFPWGKYKGTPIADLVRTDPSFVDWALYRSEGVRTDPYLEQAIRKALAH